MERPLRSCIHEDTDTLVVAESTIMRPPWVLLAATRLCPTSLKIDGFQKQKMSRMSSPDPGPRAAALLCGAPLRPCPRHGDRILTDGANTIHCTGGWKLYLKTSIHLQLRGVGRCIDNIETIPAISDFIISIEKTWCPRNWTPAKWKS